MSEFRRNPYARAMLATTMARFRSDRTEQEALFTEAVDLLRWVPYKGVFRDLWIDDFKEENVGVASLRPFI